VSDDNLMGLGPYLRMEGIVQRVVPFRVTEADMLNLKRTLYLLDHVYRFSGLGDGSTPLNETSEKLLTNYAASFIQIALQLRKPLLDKKAEIEKAQASAVPPAGLAEKKQAYADTLGIVLSKLDQCIALIPWDWRPRALRHDMLVTHGRVAEAETKIREALKIEPEKADYLRMLAQTLEMQGKKKEAGDLMRKMMESTIDSWESYLSAAQKYLEMGAVDSAIMAMQQFAELHPDDQRALSVLDQLQKFKKQREQAVTAAGAPAAK
jgi:predicted Zn-dependent protease